MAKTRAQLLMLIARALRTLRDQHPFDDEQKWKARAELCDELEAALLSASTNLRRQRRAE